VELVDLSALDGRGPAWGTASEELNATLLVWRPGEGQPEHVNDACDVVVVALAGAGTLTVDGAVHGLRAGTLAIVPRGATRSVVAGAEGLRCLTVHRLRGGLGMTDFRGSRGTTGEAEATPGTTEWPRPR
jgi:mannose-6-phosphate isomerase-like protein (cupin superfamily)